MAIFNSYFDITRGYHFSRWTSLRQESLLTAELKQTQGAGEELKVGQGKMMK
jgi:hypothetical protein